MVQKTSTDCTAISVPAPSSSVRPVSFDLVQVCVCFVRQLVFKHSYVDWLSVAIFAGWPQQTVAHKIKERFVEFFFGHFIETGIFFGHFPYPFPVVIVLSCQPAYAQLGVGAWCARTIYADCILNC